MNVESLMTTDYLTFPLYKENENENNLYLKHKIEIYINMNSSVFTINILFLLNEKP